MYLNNSNKIQIRSGKTQYLNNSHKIPIRSGKTHSITTGIFNISCNGMVLLKYKIYLVFWFLSNINSIQQTFNHILFFSQGQGQTVERMKKVYHCSRCDYSHKKKNLYFLKTFTKLFYGNDAKTWPFPSLKTNIKMCTTRYFPFAWKMP